MRNARTAALVAAVFAVAWCAGSYGQGDPAPEEMTGTVKVGDKAPDFTLMGVDGEEHSLSEYTSKGNVALMFFRSADW